MFGDYQSCKKMYTFERVDDHTFSWYGEQMSDIFFRGSIIRTWFDESFKAVNVNSVNLFSFWVRVG